MGFFSFIGDIFETVVTKPIVSIHKGVTSFIGVDPFKDPVKFATLPITVPLSLVAPVVGSITSAILPAQAPPRQVGVSQARGISQPGAGSVPLGGATVLGQSASTVRQGITGGTAAFGSFASTSLTGGNPAWHFLGQSSVRLGGSVVSSGRSPGRWVQSGNSVRLLPA